MSKENKGMTIKELKDFLAKLPEKFDEYGMVNGEVAGVEEFYVRVDKPIIHIEVDEQNEEFCLYHQSEEDIKDIISKSNDDTQGPKE